MRLAGSDGCPTGWVAAVAEAGSSGSARLIHATDLRTLLIEVDFAVIDMPIGFVDGPASRDVEAAMRRAALAEVIYFDASFANERALGKRLPKQSFMLFPKMREIDNLVREIGQDRLREGHPEVSFALMAGAPVLSRKRTAEGAVERVALLEQQGIPARALLGALIRGRMAADDVLDAAALLWSADRFWRNQHETLPPVPSRDAVGLEMSVIA
jgi:predicted RNase H-like nuclease